MMVCPDAETLAGLIEDRLSDAERETVAHHVASCATCLDVLAAAMPSMATEAVGRATSAAGSTRIASSLLRRAVAPAPPRRRRLAIAAGLTLLATAGLGYGGARLLLGAVRTDVAERAARAFGMPVTIETTAVGVTSDLSSIEVRLGGIRVGRLGHAPAVAVVVPVGALMHGRPTIERVRLLQPSLAWNGSLDEPRAAGTVHGLPQALAAVPRIEVDAGALALVLPGEPELRIDAITGSVDRREGALDLDFTGTAAGGRLSLTGRVAEPSGDLVLHLEAEDLDAAALPLLRRWLAGTAQGSLTITGSPTGPRYAGRLTLAPGQLVGWNPLQDLLTGPSTITPAALAAAAPSFAGDQLPVDELHLTVGGADKRPPVVEVELRRAGVVLTGTLALSPAGELQGSGSARVPRAVAETLARTLPALAAGRETNGDVILPFSVTGHAGGPRVLPAASAATSDVPG